MVYKKIVAGFGITIAIIAALLFMTGKVTHAQNAESSDPALMAKLDQVLTNQNKIINDLSQMKEQIRILTLRVTQAQ